MPWPGRCPPGDLGGLKRRTRSHDGPLPGLLLQRQGRCPGGRPSRRISRSGRSMSHQVAILGGGPAGLVGGAAAWPQLGIKRNRAVRTRERRWAACRAIAAIRPLACANSTGSSAARPMRAASPPRRAASRSAPAPPSPPSSPADGFVSRSGPWRERPGSQAILLAFGVRETPRSARLIGGDRPWGVITTGALQQFVYLQKIRPFRRAVIVGTRARRLLRSAHLAPWRHRDRGDARGGSAHHRPPPRRLFWRALPSACRY